VNPPALATREEQIRDLRAFLGRVGRVPAPDDLATMNDRNACMGLLMILSEAFSKCRWELMQYVPPLPDPPFPLPLFSFAAEPGRLDGSAFRLSSLGPVSAPRTQQPAGGRGRVCASRANRRVRDTSEASHLLENCIGMLRAGDG
jgi:hypothetical protein